MRGRTFFLTVTVCALALAGCSWTQDLGGPTRTDHQAFAGVDASNAARLTEQWRTRDTAFFVGAADGDAVYGVHGERLDAYALSGAQCAGTPRICDPTWTADLSDSFHDPQGPSSPSSPILADDQVAVAYLNAGYWRLAVFDRHGLNGCSGGTPRMCADVGHVDALSSVFGSPRELTAADGVLYASFRAQTGGMYVVGYRIQDLVGCSSGPTCAPVMQVLTDGSTVPPVVSRGHLYLLTSSGVAAFALGGQRGCSVSVCYPEWIDDVPGGGVSALAESSGRLVVVRQGAPMVFDADGRTGCSGVGIPTCQPLWSGPVASTGILAPRAPIVTGSMVVTFTVPDISRNLTAFAFPLDAGDRCSGTPVVCAPAWTVDLHLSGASNAVGSGDVGIVGGTGGPAAPGPWSIFRLDGAGCAPDRTCPLVATLPPTIGKAPYGAVAGRVVSSAAGAPVAVYGVGLPSSRTVAGMPPTSASVGGSTSRRT
jgi:hypothetical protein